MRRISFTAKWLPAIHLVYCSSLDSSDSFPILAAAQHLCQPLPTRSIHGCSRCLCFVSIVCCKASLGHPSPLTPSAPPKHSAD